MWSGKVSRFIQLIRSGQMTSLVRKTFTDEGRNVSPYEEHSWDVSLPEVAKLLEGRGFDNHHIQILVEVALPGTSARADVILLGMSPHQARGAVVIELKSWSAGIRGSEAEMVERGANYQILHPCSQVQGYRDYLRLYSAALVDRTPKSEVHGCAFLHALADVEPLGFGLGADAEKRNRSLVSECPAFGKHDYDKLAGWIAAKIPTPPDAAYVTEFQRLERRASVTLAKTFKEIVDRNETPWVLLDAQREIMAVIEKKLKQLAAGEAPKRQVIVVTGDPGSGKTVLALNALMQAVGSYALTNSYLVTTSSAQKASLDGELALTRGEYLSPTRKLSTNPILKASDCRIKVSMTTGQKNSEMSDEKWAAYCADWRRRHAPKVMPTPQFDVLVVDEAQGLVDPSKQFVDGSPSNPWRKPFGPQAWHIMMQAQLAIFFMDPHQGYRQVESTHPDDIIALAKQEKIPCTVLSLGDEQFRVLGGRHFVTWINNLFGLEKPALPSLSIAEREQLRGVFTIVNHPDQMRDSLKSTYEDGDKSCRLLAGYAWEWVSKDDLSRIDSHQGLGTPIHRPARRPAPRLQFRWASKDHQREFNLGTDMYGNALSLFGSDSYPATVGYPLTVRGRDINHVGVLWGRDLIWRDGRWACDHKLVFGTDMPQLRTAARDDMDRGKVEGHGIQSLVEALARAYRILLTRGMKSVQLWIEDEATATHVRNHWAAFLNQATSDEAEAVYVRR